jgi:RNA polymerase sigma-70 factor (sigma-E family)
MRTQTRDAQFRAFYFAESGRLRRLALFLTGNQHEAEDLSQEALLRTYRAWGRIRGAEAGPYCRRTLVNLHRNSLRRKIVERKHPPEPPPDASRSDPQIVEALRVADALKSLSPVRRATVVLRFYEDLPEAEIARVLDRPLGTVKSDLHRALRQMRPLFEDSLREAR